MVIAGFLSVPVFRYGFLKEKSIYPDYPALPPLSDVAEHCGIKVVRAFSGRFADCTIKGDILLCSRRKVFFHETNAVHNTIKPLKVGKIYQRSLLRRLPPFFVLCAGSRASYDAKNTSRATPGAKTLRAIMRVLSDVENVLEDFEVKDSIAVKINKRNDVMR